MKTVCLVLIFAFALENCCASAQQYTVHACKDGTVRLNCLSGLIQVHSVVHGDSSCYGSRCCPRQNDCRGSPSATYRNQVNAACNGRSSCSMNVEIRNIGCGLFAPRNDYTNITYSCIATPTSPASTIFNITPSPTPPSSSSASTSQSSTKSTPTPVDNKASDVGQQSTQSPSYHFDNTPKSEAPNMGQQSTQSTSTPNYTPPKITPPNNTPAFASDERNATEIKKEEVNITPSQSYIEEFPKPNPMYPQKPGKDSSESEHGKSAALVQTEDKDYGYLDRINTLVAVIVAGVVITATVISVAVVLALKKRRTAKIEEQYDMPNFNNQSCSANNDDENVRNENFYDFIPEPNNCSSRDSGVVECTAKEDEYLKPVLDCEDSEETPYVWVP